MGGVHQGRPGPALPAWRRLHRLLGRARIAPLPPRCPLRLASSSRTIAGAGHPLPAALDDAVVAWRISGAQVVAGESAGGGLALALMLKLRESGERLPMAAALLSP